jgi:signal transduction histidine kinase
MLDDLGLMSALRWLTQQVDQRHNMKVSLQVSDGVGRLEPDTETAVFRIVQEALTNIERHAQADTVEVRADMESDHVFVMRIHDNGRGFDVQAAQDLASSGASMGVLGMEERATLIGGNLEFASSPGEGTTITLRCPLVTQVTC